MSSKKKSKDVMSRKQMHKEVSALLASCFADKPKARAVCIIEDDEGLHKVCINMEPTDAVGILIYAASSISKQFSPHQPPELLQ